ncbi:MAG: type I DNA topoisomerase [Clostridia bacterium]|nr:type I DNA topoisomerase [Clostridia bacterium]
MMKLVILESPTKAGTVGRILGSDYKVAASKGHVRDLPETMLGVKINGGVFEPVYVNLRDKISIINTLKKQAKEADCVYLASDPDREGEAIAWHLAYVLKITDVPVYRVTFNEITEKGIKEGMSAPRAIDRQLVDSYQARRVLDRLVGYQISPILWKKFKNNLSAGRVQSVATRLICDREEEIANFVPKEYWSVDALLYPEGNPDEKFKAGYYGKNGKKVELKNEEEALEILKAVKGKKFTVTEVRKNDKKQSPYPAFTTSTLQQDCAHKLGYAPSRTMQLAQTLYEGVNIEGAGLTGLITYIRTDSVRVSDSAVDAARDYILKKFGQKYLPAKKRYYRNKSSAQDAHEAIRPAHIEMTPEMLKGSLKPELYKLYKLIYDRFIASQMADMVLAQTSVTLDCEGHTFKSAGSVVKFKGFGAEYDSGAAKDEDGKAEPGIPDLNTGEKVLSDSVTPEQHFTQPPPRYNEGSLVKALEDLGIGRPSTYATIISTIVSREYVRIEKKTLYPTEVGTIVTGIMKNAFPEIVDVKFTAGMEDNLDAIAAGEKDWQTVLADFYGPFSKELEEADSKIEKIKQPVKMSDRICEKCGKPMVYRKSKFGEFLGCSGYPSCKNIISIPKEVGKVCPECGKPLVYKKSAKGRQFISCSGYPECKFASTFEPTGKNCPKCGKYLVYKTRRGGRRYIACSDQNCGYVPSSAKNDGEKTENV